MSATEAAANSNKPFCSQAEVPVQNIENWRASLKRQRLKPYEGFAEMIQ